MTRWLIALAALALVAIAGSWYARRSGRKALYFGNQVSIGIVGWPEDRARGFIRQLTTHACQPAYQYRHRWRVGDAVLWDNRRVLHAGTFYNLATETRLMHRTTFRETEPV